LAEEQEIPEELYEHHQITADAKQGLLRLDKFLSDRISHLSRNRIQQAASADSILVNGKAAKPSYKVKPNDEISIVLPYPKHEFELLPEDIPLNIVYEDEFLLVLNKPDGMVVHPGHGNFSGTLVNALLYHINQLPVSPSPSVEREVRPGLVHRLDKDTTGLLVVAKEEVAMTHLARQFFDRTIDRNYVALVWGDIVEDEGTITGHIGRSRKNRTLMQVYPDGEHGKMAITHWKVIERFGYVTMVECKLETGRTHQIRVHFKEIGHPLFNDAAYGGDRILKGTTFTKYKQFVQNCFKILQRQALHAKSLGFEHPNTGKEMYFESELPEDLHELVEKWRNYSVHQEGQ